MPYVNCPQCSFINALDAFTYWDIEDTDIRCQKCAAVLTLTLKGGQLKKLRVKEPATSME